jgi:hypothetical protein
MSPRLHEGTLADLRTLMGRPLAFRRGYTAIEQLTAPAAGSNFVQTITADYWRRLRTLSFQFVSGATGSDRSVSLAFADGSGNIFDQVPIVSGLPASRTIAAYGDDSATVGDDEVITQSGYGIQTSPVASTAIVTISGLGPGIWNVAWNVELAGTLAEGTDNDNFKLVYNGGVVAQSVNPAVVGTYPQESVQVEGNTITTLTCQNIATATVGAIYSCEIVVSAVEPNYVRFRLPDFVLQPGWQVQLNIGNLVGTDQLSNILSLQEHYASDWASGTDAMETEQFIDALLGRLADG